MMFVSPDILFSVAVLHTNVLDVLVNIITTVVVLFNGLYHKDLAEHLQHRCYMDEVLQV